MKNLQWSVSVLRCNSPDFFNQNSLNFVGTLLNSLNFVGTLLNSVKPLSTKTCSMARVRDQPEQPQMDKCFGFGL